MHILERRMRKEEREEKRDTTMHLIKFLPMLVLLLQPATSTEVKT